MICSAFASWSPRVSSTLSTIAIRDCSSTFRFPRYSADSLLYGIVLTRIACSSSRFVYSIIISFLFKPNSASVSTSVTLMIYCCHFGLYIKDCKVACSNLLVQPNNLKVRITNIFIFSTLSSFCQFFL